MSRQALWKGRGPAGDDDDGKDELLSKMERGVPRKASKKALDHMTSFTETLLDSAAWNSFERLIRAFRLTQYLDVILSLANLITTLIMVVRDTSNSFQIPGLTIALGVISILVPWLGIGASFHMQRRTILFVAIYNLIYKVGYTSVEYIYFYKITEASKETSLVSEAVFSALRFGLGLVALGFGLATYRKLRYMYYHQHRLLFVGLDGAGKSLLIDSLHPQQVNRNGSNAWLIPPTAGMHRHKFIKFDAFWTIWDMSGNGRGRAMWPYYLSSAQAIVFVVDATDLKRLNVAKREFERLLEHNDTRKNSPLISVLLNKTDQPELRGKHLNRISVQQLRQIFQLDMYSQRLKLKVQQTSGIAGSGIEEALQWILDESS